MAYYTVDNYYFSRVVAQVFTVQILRCPVLLQTVKTFVVAHFFFFFCFTNEINKKLDVLVIWKFIMINAKVNFPWTEEREIAFLETIQTFSAHVSNNSNSTTRWTQVMDSMRNQSSFGNTVMANFWDKNNSDKSVVTKQLRKFKEKFQLIMETGKTFLASGNTSKKDGELDRKHELINVMMIAMEEKEVEDEAKAEAATDAKLTKTFLDKTSDDIIKGTTTWKKPLEGYGKRKHLDGSISDTKSVKKITTFEDSLVNFLHDEKSNKADMNQMDQFDNRFTVFLNENAYDMDKLIENCTTGVRDSDSVVEWLSTLGMNYIISLYCTYKDLPRAQASKAFREQLKEDTDMIPLAVSKCYFTLQKWHNEMESKCAESNNETSFIVTTPNSISNRSSNGNSDVISGISI